MGISDLDRLRLSLQATLAGTYLAAATSYAALFKQSPVGLKYNAGLDEKTAAILQEAAQATVKEYYGR